MKTLLIPFICLAIVQPAYAADSAVSPQTLAEQGLKAGARFPGLADICNLSQALTLPGGAPASAGGNEQKPPAWREASTVMEPQKVFDNLYFLGTRGVTSWAITTSKGIILIDALDNDEEARQYIEGGLKKLGLDPNDIRYLIITHAHGDHYGGQQFLVDTYKPKVVMSEEDWKELEKPELEFSNPDWGLPPKRDVSIKDGDTIKLGDTVVQLYVTPGHTPGTVSLIFPVMDGIDRHVVGLWGGTGMRFGPDEQRIRNYSVSAGRFHDIAEQQSVDVFLSNHPARDGALEAIAKLKDRSPGEPHPFVTGTAALGAFELLRDCSLAQAERIKLGN
ncbi:MBL fold metallo-hydrolase [Neorhizobium lilium]|uniref:MBL fold metallo-hydrolase n=1 Tax=Neorhizobium lilium TaxID=2503024 RepID=A0A3S3VEE0_9HYPH|nr:MBL fold metallo-hydrolase [Neorhizobium lilium]RWX74688.1 MBL fold metallo-hydrolase [Neorhizobium lilium]